MRKKRGTILIIDDDEDVLITAKMILRGHYEKVLTESSPKKLESLLHAHQIDIIILDMNFKTGATDGNEGLFWLRTIKKRDATIKVIMNTAYGDIHLAVACMKEGAIDFLVKPWERQKLLTTVSNVYHIKESEEKIVRLEETKKVLAKDIETGLGKMIGASEAMKIVFETIKKVAKTDANVLILGENGTGKELVARAIHNLSKRKNKDFVKVDLGSLSHNLLESELFGHVKGAFTDAKSDKPGRFEVAHEGSLFLDEIGNIPPAQQIKLLTVLQNRQVTRIGSSKATSVDIRLISATNKTIHTMVTSEEFREDLLYRINTIEIELPPLRERTGDIALLVRHFINAYSQKYEKKDLKVTAETIEKLEKYEWPGNIRQLQHAVERAVIMSESNFLTPEDFLMKPALKKNTMTHSLNIEEVEKQTISEAIKKNQGNLTMAAKELGMGRSTLYRKMKKYNITL